MSSADSPVDEETGAPAPPPAAPEGARWRAAKLAARRDMVAVRRTYVEMSAVLGLETTLLAWLRTAISVMIFGFFVARTEVAVGPLLRDTGFPHAGAWLGLAVIVGAGAGSGLAALRYLASYRAIRAGAQEPPTAAGPAAVALAAAALGFVVLALLLGVAYTDRPAGGALP